METPEVRYATTRDGASIAYSRMGRGPVLLETPHSGFGGLTALEVPAYRSYYEALAEQVTVVTYDTRGLYNSGRGEFEYSQQSHIADLEAVVEASELDSFHLFAAFHASPAGIAYAAAHPERVRSLMVWQGYVDGDAYSRKAATAALRPLVTDQVEMFTTAAAAVAKPATLEDERAMAAFLAHALGVEEQSPGRRYLEASRTMSAAIAARAVQVPTLILYREGATSPPPEFARELATLIPAAQLRRLTGESHVPPFGDILEVVEAVLNFVGTGERQSGQPRDPAPSAFQTIMFTDLESSTALTQRLGDAAAQDILHGHNDAVRKSLEDNGGREVKHTGDGIMAAFPSAVRAVEAALQIQRDLAGGEVRVRIGLNAGEPIAEDDDFFGTAVQLAARVCDRAEPGQVLVSRVVADLCAGKQLSFQHHSAATLKGFDEPVALFEVGG